MSKKLSYIFVLFGFLGFLTLIPGVFDKAAYMYFRVVDGSTIEVGDKCFKVPYGWVIDSTDNHSGHALFNLRKKTEDDHLFVSVIVDSVSIIANHGSLNPIKEVSGLYSIYELEGLALKNTVRYWSSIPNQTLLLMGRDIDTLSELSEIIWSKGC